MDDTMTLPAGPPRPLWLLLCLRHAGGARVVQADALPADPRCRCGVRMVVTRWLAETGG